MIFFWYFLKILEILNEVERESEREWEGDRDGNGERGRNNWFLL